VITADTRFYFTGGNLERDAPSYVARQADTELYDGLAQGEFCYVLTSRQMGKSSLMARTAARLRQEGIAVVALDLTAIGQNVSVEQWYWGVLGLLGHQLDLEDELDDFWLEHQKLGPLQRWMAALHDIVLMRVPGRVVIFIDEIDYVRSLPFSTDEFFAGIRECYNRRTEDPEFRRLTFCLLGVASPSDLIRDSRTTPFNIGRRIQLHDFSEGEAMPLARGLAVGEDFTTKTRRYREEEARALLRRVLQWTGGHPYLTQRLCQAVADASDEPSGPNAARGEMIRRKPRMVDQLCEEWFLSRAPRDGDHLQLVPQRLLQEHHVKAGPADPASLLDLYARVHRTTVRDDGPFLRVLRRSGLLGLYWRARCGPPVRDDDTNPLIEILRLSGMIRVVDGVLQVRNRIYQRVFDWAWVAEHMPDAELRRQRIAYRRGLLRATAVSAMIVIVTAGLALMALIQARRAAEGQRALRRHLYAAQMGLAQQAWNAGNVGRAIELVEAQRPQPGQEDLRSFEWRYLWHLCHRDVRFTLRGHQATVTSVAFSPDGAVLATGSDDRTIRLWDLASQRLTATIAGQPGFVSVVRFSPDGKRLASGASDSIRLWDRASRREIARFHAPQQNVEHLDFSPDGRLLASVSSGLTASQPGRVALWDLAARREIARLTSETGRRGLAFSPNCRTLAFEDHGVVKLWDLAARRTVATMSGHAGGSCLAFSPDGTTLAASSLDGTIGLWDIATKRERARLKGHEGDVYALAFSPDGRRVATCSDDLTIRLWDTATKQEQSVLRGHGAVMWDLAFSPDGTMLASASSDRTVKLWNAVPRREENTLLLRGHAEGVLSAAFSPDGKLLASGGPEKSVRLWNVASHREVGRLLGQTGANPPMAFSPDGKVLACGGGDGRITLWDIASRHAIATLRGHSDPVSTLAFSPDGKLLASGKPGSGAATLGEVKLWDVPTRRELATLPGSDPTYASSVAFSPDGRLLAVGSFVERAVRRWEVATRRQLSPLRGQTGFVTCVAFSPDGRLLASGSMEGTVNLWDAETGREVASVQGHRADVFCVAFSPDGKTVASGSWDHTVKLWNVATWQEVATLSGHTGGVVSVAFSADGNTLVSASIDHTVRLWRAASFAETGALASVGLREPLR
jgi:WD40 repeat protein